VASVCAKLKPMHALYGVGMFPFALFGVGVFFFALFGVYSFALSGVGVFSYGRAFFFCGCSTDALEAQEGMRRA